MSWVRRMRCSKCATENREGRKFCGECGSPLNARCASCGAENEPAEKYCGECGGVLARPVQVGSPKASPTSPASPVIRVVGNDADAPEVVGNPNQKAGRHLSGLGDV